MGICRSCHSFNFANMRFVVGVIFFPIIVSQISPWANKFPTTENNFLPRSMKRKVAFSALYLLICFCLESAQYKNPQKECRQSINCVIN